MQRYLDGVLQCNNNMRDHIYKRVTMNWLCFMRVCCGVYPCVFPINFFKKNYIKISEIGVTHQSIPFVRIISNQWTKL